MDGIVFSWSTWLPSTLTIRVRFPLKSKLFNDKNCLIKRKFNEKLAAMVSKIRQPKLTLNKIK